MRKQKDWDSLRQVLDAINATDDALIQRNFEKMSDESYFMQGQHDIDFLCRNPNRIRKELDARMFMYKSRLSHDESPQHYFVSIRNTPVKIGLFYVGDGYFDAKWEDEMLRNKVRSAFGCFVPNSEDYFYSLLYHALFHKRTLSEEYRLRLRAMGETLGIRLTDTEDYFKTLLQYLERKGYAVPYPKDPTVSVCFQGVPPPLLQPKVVWRVRKTLFFLT